MSDEKQDDGGPAFPSTNHRFAQDSGMTLRDWFAGQALPGILLAAEEMPADLRSLPRDKVQEALAQVAAKWAYVLADAMLEARK